MNQIFHIRNDGTLVEMNETPFARETDFQSLLQKYPNLLSINQLDNDDPCRWLEIDREMRLSADESTSGRLALDHLYLDQRAIPTLIEVKRKEDTRIRREVVGQMLDYAACAAVSWTHGDLQTRFEQRCEQAALDPDAELETFLDEDQDPDEFWQLANTNLQSGRIRLVFVADLIPLELRRIIEFLNKQMDPAEVLGVELKHYSGDGLSSLVPRIIGQTAEATGRKRSASHSTSGTIESWTATAESKGVGELFQALFEQLGETFTRTTVAGYGIAFMDFAGDARSPTTMVRINPRVASPEKGIRYIAFPDRLSQLCGTTAEDAENYLPNFEKYRTPTTAGRRYVGYFRHIDEVQQLANYVKTNCSK